MIYLRLFWEFFKVGLFSVDRDSEAVALGRKVKTAVIANHFHVSFFIYSEL